MGTMTISAFTSRVMYPWTQKRKHPRGFYLNRMWNGNIFYAPTKVVDLEDLYTDQGIAAPVGDKSLGRFLEKAARHLKTVTTPRVLEKAELNAADLEVPDVGMNPYSLLENPEQRAANYMGKMVGVLDDRIFGFEEAMAWEQSRTGKITLVGDGINRTIDIGMPSGNILTLAGTDVFSDPNSDPFGVIEAHVQTITDEGGIPPTECYIGTNVARDILALPYDVLKKHFGILNIKLGDISPEKIDNGTVYKLGTLNYPQLDIYVVAQQYKDTDGNWQRFLPKGDIVFDNPVVERVRIYGGFDVKDESGNWVKFMGRRHTFLKRETKPDKDTLWQESRPLSVLLQPESVGCIHATDNN